MITQGKQRPSTAANGAERRSTPRRDATTLGPVSARIVGGEGVRLLDFSRHGILLESAVRLLIGVRATLRLVTIDASLTVHGRVVRSKVAKAGPSGLVYHTALALDEDLSALEAAVYEGRDTWNGVSNGASPAPATPAVTAAPSVKAAAGSERAKGGKAVGLGDETADLVLEFLATVPHDLEELRRRAAVNNW